MNNYHINQNYKSIRTNKSKLWIKRLGILCGVIGVIIWFLFYIIGKLDKLFYHPGDAFLIGVPISFFIPWLIVRMSSWVIDALEYEKPIIKKYDMEEKESEKIKDNIDFSEQNESALTSQIDSLSSSDSDIILNKIEKRLDNIEKKNFLYKLLYPLILILIGILISIIIFFNKQNTIEANKFLLIDSTGKHRAELSLNNDGNPFLAFINKDGIKSSEINLYGFNIYDKKGENIIFGSVSFIPVLKTEAGIDVLGPEEPGFSLKAQGHEYFIPAHDLFLLLKKFPTTSKFPRDFKIGSTK